MEWTPSHSAPKLPNLPPAYTFLPTPGQCQHFSTFFSRTLWEGVTDQICVLLQKSQTTTLVSIDSYCHFVEKAWVPLTGFTISVLFAPLACFYFYLHFTGSVYASQMLAISLEMSTLRGNSTWHKNTSRYNNEDASQGGGHQNGLERQIWIQLTSGIQNLWALWASWILLRAFSKQWEHRGDLPSLEGLPVVSKSKLDQIWQTL